MKTQQNTLKLTFIAFLLVSLFSLNAQAQTTVKASNIMKAIKNREDIKYSNVTVSGTLDFTYMDEKAPDLPRRRSWWRNGGFQKL